MSHEIMASTVPGSSPSSSLFGKRDRRARMSIVAVIVMLVPALVGAALGWPWWIEYLLIAPAAIWCIATGRVFLEVEREAQVRRMRSKMFPIAVAMPIVFAATINRTRWSGLGMVAAFILMLVVAIYSNVWNERDGIKQQ